MTSHERSKPKTRARQKTGARQIVQEQGGGAPEVSTQSSELEWHERAAFHVTFESADDASGHVLWQIRAYHEESDSRAMWSGIPGETMINWICDKAGLTSETSLGEPPADLQLTIGDLRLDEVPIERQTGGLDRVNRLQAGIDFQLAGPVASHTSVQRSHYITHILACTPAAGAMTILAADRQELRPEALAYTATLEFEVPETGIYQLLAIVLLPDAGAVGITLGPMLSVIP